jgi:hypothetical protein
MRTKNMPAEKEHQTEAEASEAVEHGATQERRNKQSSAVGSASGDRTLALRSDSAEHHQQGDTADRPLDYLSLSQLASSVPGDLSDSKAIDAAVNRFLAFQPTDATESMLALLAVGISNSAMDGLARASRAGANPPVRHMELKLAFSAVSTGIDLLKALQSHRGCGDQKVSVGNVNVGSGGQAIVGHLQARSPAKQEGEER